MNQVVIRPPVVTRVYVVGFLIFWLGGVVWSTMIRHRGSSVLVGVVFIVLGLALGYRLVRLSVRADPHGALAVRNNLGSKRFERGEIEDFRVGTNGARGIGQRSIQALLRDGTTYALDVTRAPFGFGKQRTDRQLEELKSWLLADS